MLDLPCLRPRSAAPAERSGAHEPAEDGAAEARRAAAGELARVEPLADAQHGLHAEPAQRLGLPAREGRADQRERGALALAPEDQLRERAAREVRRGDALADVAAGPGEPTRAVDADRRPPAARHRDRPRPAVLDRAAAQRREEGREDALDARVVARRLGEALGHGGAEEVAPAAPE